jgi:hypothetical protein
MLKRHYMEILIIVLSLQAPCTLNRTPGRVCVYLLISLQIFELVATMCGPVYSRCVHIHGEVCGGGGEKRVHGTREEGRLAVWTSAGSYFCPC